MSILQSRAQRAVAAITVALVAVGGTLAAQAASTKVSSTTFSLFPNAAVQNCFAAPGKTPIANVTVTRGHLNDTLTLHARNIKPRLNFDLFTVEKAPQLSDGSPNPNFGGNFGFAWYQSDVHADSDGRAEVTIKTVLLDQIFGFDASRGVPPVNTFNVGFWFNDPADAANCNFTGFTPFNGEHHAGPVAMISRQDVTTKLGPLCTDPVSQGGGVFTCNP
jgi:hypothetical protein